MSIKSLESLMKELRLKTASEELRVNHQKHTYPILPPRKYLNSNVRPYQNILLGH